MGKKLEAKNHKVIKRSDDPRLYEMMEDLIKQYHPHLATAKIVLIWRYGWKPNRDGRLTLGQCKKASDLEIELGDFNFAILLNAERWPKLTHTQRQAVIDHELCHATATEDKATGKMKWGTRGHDLEEFNCIVQRYGLWRDDVKAFVNAATGVEEPTLFTGDGNEDNSPGEEGERK